MSTLTLREAARAILLDHDDRVMLLRYDENDGFWGTPGGSLEPGESHDDAVVRELREELGIQKVDLGPLIATRTKDHRVGGEQVRQVERYYLARTSADQVQPQSAAQPDNIQEWRWWTLPQLDTTEQTVYPIGLSTLIHDFLASGAPPAPIVLT